MSVRSRFIATGATAALLLLGAAPAHADEIVGTANAVQPCGQGLNLASGAAITQQGKVTEFRFKAVDFSYGPGPRADLQILRPIGNDAYKVIGHTGPVASPSDNSIVHTPAAIYVEPGDVLGLYLIDVYFPCVSFGSPSARYGYPASDPAVGDSFTTYNDPGEVVNLQVTVVDATPPSTDAVVKGAGSTKPSGAAPANQFSISTLNQAGTLSYSSASTTFNGTIQCVKIVGNSATLVAVDSATGKANRTMVQDNGASGDKLVNTLFDPAALSAKARAKALECVAPDLAKLSAASALTGDAIQISGATPPPAL